MSDRLGLKNNARNPGSIINIQHHDASGSQRNLQGSPSQIDFIIPDSSIATPIEDNSVLRVANTTGSDAFIYVGRADLAPLTVDATTGLLMHGQSVEHFFSGSSDDHTKSLVVKTSSTSVQVVVMK